MINYTKAQADLITLSSFEELTYRAKYILLDGLKSEKCDFEKYRKILIKSVPEGVYNKVKDKFYSQSYRKKLFSVLEEKGVECVTLFSENYPVLLRDTEYPPVTLFCKGDISLLNTRCFAVVGSRRSTAYALKHCEKLSGEICTEFTLVTGAADGADTAAMNGALDAGGKVIAVLAHGFDYVYPASNAQLFDEVIKSGLLISEYPPYVSPKSFLFPVRNRIIAGLSEGTLVVSAGEKSGALITADYAYNYGRTVFAVPYAPHVSSGAGCNALIRKGAVLCRDITDIFEEFGLSFNAVAALQLTELEKNVLEILKQSGEIFVNDLAETLNLQPYELLPSLSALEIKKLAVRLGGNRYSAT